MLRFLAASKSFTPAVGLQGENVRGKGEDTTFSLGFRFIFRSTILTTSTFLAPEPESPTFAQVHPATSLTSRESWVIT
jgi:hypothetical protein